MTTVPARHRRAAEVQNPSRAWIAGRPARRTPDTAWLPDARRVWHAFQRGQDTSVCGQHARAGRVGTVQPQSASLSAACGACETVLADVRRVPAPAPVPAALPTFVPNPRLSASEAQRAGFARLLPGLHGVVETLREDGTRTPIPGRHPARGARVGTLSSDVVRAAGRELIHAGVTPTFTSGTLARTLDALTDTLRASRQRGRTMTLILLGATQSTGMHADVRAQLPWEDLRADVQAGVDAWLRGRDVRGCTLIVLTAPPLHTRLWANPAGLTHMVTTIA